jgi:flagellar biosynthesis/type III secretory pathway protein FliH
MDTLLSARRPTPQLATTRFATPGPAASFAPAALFAEDFDLPRRAAMPAPEVINPTYTAADLAEARAEAWAAGHAAGTTEANGTITATTRSLLEAIAAALHDAKAAANTVAERSVEAIARLLLDSLAKLFPALCERHGETELRALIHIILPALAQEPTITVRLNPMHTPALMRELDRLDPELVERVRLLPVEAIAVGDVRVSWHDGSASRDTAALWLQVRAVLEPAGLLSPASLPTPDPPTPDPPTSDLSMPNRAPITIMETANAD